MPEVQSRNLGSIILLILTVCLSVCAFVAWTIAIGGVGASHSKCTDLVDDFEPYSTSFYSSDARFTFTDDKYCDRWFRLEWFLLVLEFVVLLSMVLVASLCRAMQTCQTLFVALLSILSMWSIYESDQALRDVDVYGDVEDALGRMWDVLDNLDEMKQALKARAAGWVLLAIVNLAFTILLAIGWERIGKQAQERQDGISTATVAPAQQYVYNVPQVGQQSAPPATKMKFTQG
eukprot:TRINITY_DN16213_c0_g1_i1.p1 TRINITY_DN16213_c0_g1~~TRINITY_DN16213_c0_g1_i1.p1  ORF type:complete len:246 (-),score=22.17 TRINITY_DN16213_c0_g1_i1:371-1069(-)